MAKRIASKKDQRWYHVLLLPVRIGLGGERYINAPAVIVIILVAMLIIGGIIWKREGVIKTQRPDVNRLLHEQMGGK